MDLSTATTKLQALRREMTGHTDRDDERRILDLLEGATREELNHLLSNVDLVHLLSDLDDRLVGPAHHTALLDLLCTRRAAELSLPVRAVFIHDVVATPQEQRDAWRERHVFFFDTYVGAAVDAFHAGVISRDGVDRVAAAARESLAAIAFPSPDQRQAREAELERDLARAVAV